jgi:hypothetical protein
VKRLGLIGGAVGCLTVAAVLIAIAADVSRWRSTLPSDDVQYRTAPGEQDLWRSAEFVPLGAARRVLGIEDDLAFRRALRALRLARLGTALSSVPRIALLRTDAQARLQAIANEDDEPARRSRAIGLVGVISFVGSLEGSQESAPLLRDAVDRFRRAIVLDPDNAEAKTNLEAALQRSRGLQPAPATGPAPGGRGSRGAGAGTPDSGY